MDRTKAGAMRAFRPWSKNAERLDYADNLGLNISEIINETLEGNLPAVLAKKIEAQKEKFRKASEAPMP
jgi:hypothetical protein